MISNNVLVL